jgi:hypothetical protein
MVTPSPWESAPVRGDVSAALRHADEALYNAKHSGRNRTCTADNPRLSHQCDRLFSLTLFPCRAAKARFSSHG